MKLQTQFSLAFIPLLILSGTGTTYVAHRAVHKAILEEAAGRGEAKLEEIAAATISGFHESREDLLLPVLTSALAREGAVYVMALDPKGTVLAHTNVLEQGKHYEDDRTREALHANFPTYRELSSKSGSFLDISWPVWRNEDTSSKTSEELMLLGAQGTEQRRLGTLRIGLPLTHAKLTERKISRQLGLLLLGADSILLGLAFLLMRSILKPVGRLVKATEEIGLGVYGAAVPIPTASELGYLAKSFNRMSRILAQTTVSKDFLDTILKYMLEPLIVLDADLKIRMVNRAALDLLGCDRRELIGQLLDRIWAKPTTVLSDVLEHGTVKDQEIVFQPKTGEAVVLFSGSRFEDKEGRLTGVIIVAKDIRERKKMEAEIVQSEKLSAVGRLASGVAHEINNPLGVILGFAQGALFDLAPGDPLQMPLKAIERESIRCKNLVQDLLTFSRVSKSEREPLDINNAVEGALSLVAAQVRLGKILLVKDLASGLPSILGNINQIQQIVVNLANNALDAMREEGTLTVRTALSVENQYSWVVLTVTDTGSGIPPEVLPRIFEPFFTTKPIGQGTGLGLGLVHEIVKKHSGAIDVKSRPGWSEFQIKFPTMDPNNLPNELK